jgi:preprotein translocase subunit SecF
MDGFQIVNYSLNQTLSRTLLTSFSTLLSMLSIYFFGGPALASFSKIMIIGIIFGTYSSIYIASPIMLLLNDQFKKYNNA